MDQQEYDQFMQFMEREHYQHQMERDAELQMHRDSVDYWNEQYNIEYEATQQYLISFDSDED
jgi:hypothetical protein